MLQNCFKDPEKSFKYRLNTVQKPFKDPEKCFKYRSKTVQKRFKDPEKSFWGRSILWGTFEWKSCQLGTLNNPEKSQIAPVTPTILNKTSDKILQDPSKKNPENLPIRCRTKQRLARIPQDPAESHPPGRVGLHGALATLIDADINWDPPPRFFWQSFMQIASSVEGSSVSPSTRIIRWRRGAADDNHQDYQDRPFLIICPLCPALFVRTFSYSSNIHRVLISGPILRDPWWRTKGSFRNLPWESSRFHQIFSVRPS